MNDLETYFYNNKGRGIHKWRHYFEIYDRHFARYRNQSVNIVEIGVYKGGSLQMWKHYFGPKANIIGVDVNPKCKDYEEEGIQVVIGDQEDRTFLKELAKATPRIDILIDDGGHTMRQQIVTFEELFPHVDARGVYLCEDMHTSYRSEYGGEYANSDTFVEYSKNFIDYINAWHARPAPVRKWYQEKARQLSVSDFTRTAHSLHYYDSVLVIEKRPIAEPSDLMTGADTHD